MCKIYKRRYLQDQSETLSTSVKNEQDVLDSEVKLRVGHWGQDVSLKVTSV